MLLVCTDPLFEAHDPGRGHPERPERLRAVAAGIARAGMREAIVPLVARDATDTELRSVHTAGHLAALAARANAGGGPLDIDTVMGSDSWAAARRAAGAGPSAAAELRRGGADAAFLAVRPPGHHALPARAMGFCLLNNVAVTAASLAEGGERVLVVDIDAHHGNGTQDTFYRDPRVCYVSLHEWPLYPGTGRLEETGEGEGLGTTCNLPLPAGATGDVYLAALDEVVMPLAERFAPDWLLISAGFDAHRADPLTGLGLSAGDYALVTARLCELVPPGRVIAFLEGGYDLGALCACVQATLPALVGVPPGAQEGEAPTAGGPGGAVVRAAADLRRRSA